jgi:cell division protein FtsI (penicillin-binding protein 3)
MLQAATAIANDGVLSTPHYIKSITAQDGSVLSGYRVPEPRRVFSAETARSVRSFMVDVTSAAGTGWRANVDDISMAVKTGTAQLIDRSTGRYSDTDFIASCIALLPAENPTLIIYLAIVKPKGESFLGGRIASPSVREAAEAVINYSGIPRGRNERVSHSGVIQLDGAVLPDFADTMPDLSGFTKRQLLPLLLRDDIEVELQGDGRVRRQSPAAGTALGENAHITLELE